MTVAVSFCAFNASGATVNVQEVAPTYVGFVYGECSDNPPPTQCASRQFIRKCKTTHYESGTQNKSKTSKKVE